MQQFNTITLAGVNISIPTASYIQTENGLEYNSDLPIIKPTDKRFYILAIKDQDGVAVAAMRYKTMRFNIVFERQQTNLVLGKPTNMLITTLDYAQNITELLSTFGVMAHKHGRGASHLLLATPACSETIKLEVEAVKQGQTPLAIPILHDAAVECVKQSFAFGLGRLAVAVNQNVK